MFKVGAVFAHGQSKTTMCQQFRALFATVLTQPKSFWVNMTMDETWIHYFTLESNWQSAELTAAGENHPMQALEGKVLASVFWDAQHILFIDYLLEKKNHQ